MEERRSDSLGHGSCATCLGTDGKRSVVRVVRTYPLGTRAPLKVELTTLGCTACGRVREGDKVARAFEEALCRAIVAAGLVNHHTFRVLRSAAGISSKGASALLFVDPGTLSRWENGHRACDERAWAIVAVMAMENLELPVPAMKDVLAAMSAPSELRPMSLVVAMEDMSP